MERPKRKAARISSERIRELLEDDSLGAALSTEEGTITSDDEFLNVVDQSDICSDDSDDCDGRKAKVVKEYHQSRGYPKDDEPQYRLNLSSCSTGSESGDFSEAEVNASLEAEVDDALSNVQEISVMSTAKSNNKSKSKERKPGSDGKSEWQCWEDELEIQANTDSCNLGSSSKVKVMGTKEPPPEILMALLPFQKEWLWWSLKQESSDTRGGILADEMGMGKTIQAICLILAGRALRKSIKHKSEFLSFDLNMMPVELRPQLKATLVICPLVALPQWRDEITHFTRKGSVKVLTYHGANRCNNISELAKYDIVLTTYQTAEVEHRMSSAPTKEACKYCGKRYVPSRLSIHHRYYCGPRALKTVKQAKQIRKAPRELNNSETGPLEEYDELEGNLSMLGDKSKQCKGTRGEIGGSMGRSILHSVRWERVILDEAHFIKDSKSSTAKAVFALQSNYKWALSGTPVQNRVGELYSLVRFLEITPFSYFYCKDCNCKLLDYSVSFDGGKCDCGHSPIVHFCWWNKYIAGPLKKDGYQGSGCQAMEILQSKIIDRILLRRTKLECASDLTLPPSTKFLRRDSFDAREEDFYQALYNRSHSEFSTYVNSGTLLNNYAHIFDLLTRLRQAVDHPYLVVYSKTKCDGAICEICNDTYEEPVMTSCGHKFCKACIQGYTAAVVSDLPPPCPVCKSPLLADWTGLAGEKNKGYKGSSILSHIQNIEAFQTSTKIDALREEVVLMMQRDCAAKGIVFSQFTSFLDLIGYRLEKSGINCVKLNGSMSITARERMIEKFKSDPDCKVFLMSLKAGGVALNLTVASHVFLMDPWWNPAVEQQAQDRIHRIGQFKPIRVVRFIIENTVEERILKLQEKKQLIFEGTVGGSTEALGKLTENDLRFLFSR